MALSQLQQPNPLAAAYRPVIWRYKSSSSTIVRIISDIYVNGKYQASIDVDPDIGTADEFTVDASVVIQDYLSSTTPDTSATLKKFAKETGKRIQVRSYEVLSSGGVLTTSWTEKEPGVTTGYQSGTFESLVIAATRNIKEANSIDSYLMGDSSKLFLTRRPQSIKMPEQDFYLHFATRKTIIAGLGQPPIVIRIEPFDSSGNALSAVTLSGGLGLSVWEIVIPKAIILDAWHRLTVHLLIDGVQQTEKHEIKLKDRRCDNTTDLYWVNSLGGIDGYGFTGRKVTSKQGAIRTYRKPTANTHDIANIEEDIINVSSDEEVSITSEALPQSGIEWLSELITHRTRAWVKVDEGFMPVIITGGKIITSDSEDHPLQVQVSYRMSQKQTAQRN